MAVRLTLATADELSTWSVEQTRALQCKCRAGVIDKWSDNIRRRHGQGPVDEILALIPEWQTEVGGRIDHTKFIPVAAHLELVRAMREVLGRGSFAPVVDEFIDDLRINMGRVKLFGLRRIGPGTILKQIDKIHTETYVDGRATAQVERGHAEVRFDGAPFMAHPTWQLLQLATFRALIELSGRKVNELYGTSDDGALTVVGRWS